MNGQSGAYNLFDHTYQLISFKQWHLTCLIQYLSSRDSRGVSQTSWIAVNYRYHGYKFIQRKCKVLDDQWPFYNRCVEILSVCSRNSRRWWKVNLYRPGCWIRILVTNCWLCAPERDCEAGLMTFQLNGVMSKKRLNTQLNW